MIYQIYTDIPKEFPVQFSTDIGNQTYLFKIEHNQRFDFYTLYISDSIDNLLYSIKITYFGSVLIGAIDENLDPSKNLILFVDESEFDSISPSYLHEKVDSSNMLKTVFMVIIDVHSIQ